MEGTLMDVPFLDLERGNCSEQPWTHLVSAGNDTLLHIAVKLGKEDDASSLLSSLTNPSDVCSALLRQNARGDTPLHCAARLGKVGFVDLFISKVSNIQDRIVFLSTKNKQGDTALHLAARNNHFDVVDMLMDVDPDLGSMANNSGECPLYVAAYKGFLKITKRLVRCTATGPGKKTALHAAVAQIHGDVVELLLDKRPELCNVKDETGSTPLLCAASFGKSSTLQPSVRMVQTLLDQDIFTVLLSDENGHSALHVAAAVGSIDVLKEILVRRKDFGELIDNTGKTFLHVAIENRRKVVVKHVLKEFITERSIELLNQPDYKGNTPLHMAVISGDLDIVRLLLADERVSLPNVNEDGQTPLDLANSILLNLPVKLRMRMIVEDLESCGLKSSPQRWDLVQERWRNKEEQNDEINRRRAMSDKLAIVAILIATVTFGATFTLPGGYQSDAGSSDRQGTAILTKKAAFKVFLIFDTLAMLTSILSIWFLFKTESGFHDVSVRAIRVSEWLITFSVVEMIVAFLASVYAVDSTQCLWLAVLICIMACLIPLALSTRMTWAYGIRPKKKKTIFRRIIAWFIVRTVAMTDGSSPTFSGCISPVAALGIRECSTTHVRGIDIEKQPPRSSPIRRVAMTGASSPTFDGKLEYHIDGQGM